MEGVQCCAWHMHNTLSPHIVSLCIMCHPFSTQVLLSGNALLTFRVFDHNYMFRDELIGEVSGGWVHTCFFVLVLFSMPLHPLDNTTPHNTRQQNII